VIIRWLSAAREVTSKLTEKTMRKDEYIREVVSRIDNKRAKQEVEKELSAHIDDRISYYSDAGYNEEISNSKALEHMGEPRKVGIQMAKLHKKNKLAIIAVCLLIAIVLTFVVLLFTTPLSAQIVSYRYDSKYSLPSDDENYVDAKDVDYFYAAKKCGPLMNLVYRINPSVINLDACRGVYDISSYQYGIYYKNTVPENYLKYSIKYYEILYTSQSREEWSHTIAIPVIPDYDVQWKIGWGIKLACALYADGQIESSKAIIDECLDMINEDYAVMYWTMKSYFYYAYASTDDAALKNWIVEKENGINEACRGMEKYEKYFSEHDSIYYNPETLDDYFGGWDEYKEPEQNYDKIIDSLSQQLRIYQKTGAEPENVRNDVFKITNATYSGDVGSGRIVMRYQYDGRLTFELYDIPFTSCVFYLDGEEYQRIEFN
jgi:tetratricopeptide (TPR) repeat protein